MSKQGRISAPVFLFFVKTTIRENWINSIKQINVHFAEVFRFNLYLLFAGPYLAALIIERLLLTGEFQQRCRNILEHKYTIYFYLATYCIWFVVRNILKI